MAWNVKRISSNKDRAASAVRDALELIRQSDDSGGRGYSAAATAVETALGAFQGIDGYSVEIETSGDIGPDGRGYLTISVRTLDQDVLI